MGDRVGGQQGRHSPVGVEAVPRGERVAVIPAAPGHQPVFLASADAAPVLQRHQGGDAVAMIDHAFAPHLGWVGGQHGGDQRLIEQSGGIGARHAFLGQSIERRREIGTPAWLEERETTAK